MDIQEMKYMLERRQKLLEKKLKSKKEPHFNGVNTNIIIETEAKLEEIENLLIMIDNA